MDFFGKEKKVFSVSNNCKVTLLFKKGDIIKASTVPTPVAEIEIDGMDETLCMPASRLNSKVVETVDLDESSELNPSPGKVIDILTVEIQGINVMGSDSKPIDADDVPEELRTRILDRENVQKIQRSLERIKKEEMEKEVFLRVMKNMAISPKNSVDDTDNTGSEDNDTDNTGSEDNDTDNTGSEDNDADNTGSEDNDADNTGSQDNDAENIGAEEEDIGAEEELPEVQTLDDFLDFENVDEDVVELEENVLSSNFNKAELLRTAISYHRDNLIIQATSTALVDYLITKAIDEGSSIKINASPSLKSIDINTETNEWLENNSVKDLKNLEIALIEAENFTEEIITVYIQLVREDYVERMILGSVTSKDEVDEALLDKEQLLAFCQYIESEVNEIIGIHEEIDEIDHSDMEVISTMKREIIKAIIKLKPLVNQEHEDNDITAKLTSAKKLFEKLFTRLEKLVDIENTISNQGS